jgi:hypothetical protein
VKSSKGKEANIIGFKVVLDSEGIVVTEMSGVPLPELGKLLRPEEMAIIRNIVNFTKPKLEKLHGEIEAELNALNHVAVGK